MFGTITINPDELKLKDYRKYRSYYYGVCQDLKELHGQASLLTLTYDMIFLALLLTGLYEREGHPESFRCPLHPLKPLKSRRNAYTQYAVDMNVLLSYYNLLDDWMDDRKVGSLACEREKDEDMDRTAGYTGELMAEIFVYKKDEWEDSLRRMGFFYRKIHLSDGCFPGRGGRYQVWQI